MSKELKVYVESALRKGASKTEITTTLSEAGWARDVIGKTLDQYVSVDGHNIPVPAPRMQTHQVAQDICVYFLSFVTLSLSACALGTLLYNMVDTTIPDTLAHHTDTEYLAHSLNGSLAQLVVAFPIFWGLSFWTQKNVQKQPQKRDSMVRKLMIYFILTVAAIVGLGDLITVVTYFLNGGIDAQFMAKATIVLGITGAIFYYYLREMRQDDALLKSLHPVLEAQVLGK